MKSYALFIGTLLFASASLFAVEPGGDHKLAKHWKTSKEFTIAVAEQMPAESYNFKLTPAQMSFGEQMAHIAGANMYFFSTLKGEKPPNSKPADFEKTTVIKLLNDSFDYSMKALETLTPEQINKTYKAEDQEMSGAEMIMLAFDHTTHHRSACEMYLRAKNIKPTDYRF